MDVHTEISSTEEATDLSRKKKRRKSRDPQTDRSHEMLENEQCVDHEGEVFFELGAGEEKHGHKRKSKKRKKRSELRTQAGNLSETSPKYGQYLECEKEISIEIGAGEESTIRQKKKKRKRETEVGEDDMIGSELDVSYENVDSMEASSQERSPTHKRKKKKRTKESDLQSDFSGEILSPNDRHHFEHRGISTEINPVQEQTVQKKKKKKKKRKNCSKTDCENLTETNFHEVTSADEDSTNVVSTSTSQCKKRKRVRWKDQQATEHITLDHQEAGTSEEEEPQGACGISGLDVKGYIEQLRKKVGKPAVEPISDAEREINSRSHKLRNGRWLPEEDAMLRENIRYFEELNPSVDVKSMFSRNGLSARDEGTRKFRKWRAKYARKTGLYSTFLVRGLNKSVSACYKRAIYMFSDYTITGKWSEEETERLKDYMTVYGRDWRLLADKLGRTDRCVTDRYRNISSPSYGLWTADEDDRLKASVFKHCGSQSRTNDLHDGIPWVAVATDVTTRSAGQCAARWQLFLRHYTIHEAVFVWTKQKVTTLVSEICKQGVVYEELIDFDTIRKSIEGNPSARLLRRKFTLLKYSIPKTSIQSFPDLLDAIYTKHCTEA